MAKLKNAALICKVCQTGFGHLQTAMQPIKSHRVGGTIIITQFKKVFYVQCGVCGTRTKDFDLPINALMDWTKERGEKDAKTQTVHKD